MTMFGANKTTLIIMGIAVVLILLFFVLWRLSSAKARRESEKAAGYEVAYAQAVGQYPFSALSSVSSGNQTDFGFSPGVAGGGVVLTASQCKQTCKGICGKKCVVNISAACKAKKACHDNCKCNTCNRC